MEQSTCVSLMEANWPTVLPALEKLLQRCSSEELVVQLLKVMVWAPCPAEAPVFEMPPDDTVWQLPSYVLTAAGPTYAVDPCAVCDIVPAGIQLLVPDLCQQWHAPLCTVTIPACHPPSGLQADSCMGRCRGTRRSQVLWVCWSSLRHGTHTCPACAPSRSPQHQTSEPTMQRCLQTLVRWPRTGSLVASCCT